MSLDYTTLDLLRRNHPAWRLLCSDHAPLIASFLQRVFITPNRRVIAQADLVEALEDELFTLRERLGPESFPRPTRDYLDEWAGIERGWLRKFYAPDTDEPQFDLTPATEKAVAWLETLTARSFIGTESRLLTLFTLLRQMSEGSETDPQTRLAELRKRRAEIDRDIARIEGGDVPLLDTTALKDRFQQFMQLARELLSDFREVEHNFRALDRRVRERIALWEGSKGTLLEDIMGERDAIADSDQGRSFRAFWDFLMSSTRQDELSTLLSHVLSLAPVTELKPDARLGRVHYDWLEAGEHAQRTVAQLSLQLRRFLDDRAWLENRRIMDILRGIKSQALGLRSAPPPGAIISLSETAASIELAMERPLYTPPVKPVIATLTLPSGDADIDAGALYSQVIVDRTELSRHIRRALKDRSQISLRDLCALYPLRHGLAELVVYLQIAGDDPHTVVDEGATETISWDIAGAENEKRKAHVPRIIFVRPT